MVCTFSFRESPKRFTVIVPFTDSLTPTFHPGGVRVLPKDTLTYGHAACMSAFLWNEVLRSNFPILQINCWTLNTKRSKLLLKKFNMCFQNLILCFHCVVSSDPAQETSRKSLWIKSVHECSIVWRILNTMRKQCILLLFFKNLQRFYHQNTMESLTVFINCWYLSGFTSHIWRVKKKVVIAAKIQDPWKSCNV